MIERRIRWTAAFALNFALLAALSICGAAQAAEYPVGQVPADAAVKRLEAGNRRFVSGQLQPKDFARERRELLAGQHPYAIVLSCSDSRVPPEEVFDESLGKLFVVRVAGNVADPVILGSMEYAVEHLGPRLVLVLGHESCGAVKATLEGGDLPPNVRSLVERIQLAVNKARGRHLDEAGLLPAAIEENVRLQISQLFSQSEIMKELTGKQTLRILGGIYSLQSGVVSFLP